MSSHRSPGDWDGAVYVPPISRTLLEQLDQHLRGFCEATAFAGPDKNGKPAPGAPVLPTADELAGSLLLIVKAAAVMNKVDLLFRAGSGSSNDWIGELTQKVSVYQSCLDAAASQLRSAYADVEEYKQRSFVAERKLELLMSVISQSLSESLVLTLAPPTCSAPS